jgi:hypothetical protein
LGIVFHYFLQANGLKISKTQKFEGKTKFVAIKKEKKLKILTTLASVGLEELKKNEKYKKYFK